MTALHEARTRLGLVGLVRLVAPAIVGLLILLRTPVLNLPFVMLNSVAAVAGVLAVAATVLISQRHFWSASSAYLVVFVIFHLGLAILTAVGQSGPAYMVGYVDSWFNSYGSAPEALHLSALAAWCFVSGCAWRAVRPGKPATTTDDEDDEEGVEVASILGGLLVVSGTLLLFGFVWRTSPELLFGVGGSQAFWAYVEGSTFALVANPLIAYGAILLAVGRPGVARRVALVFLGLFALWALSVGARTAIMYPALTMAVVAARRHRMPGPSAAIAVFSAGMAVIAFVSQARLTGGYAQRASADPRVALAEMGSSLRPVAEVVSYRRASGEPLMYGETYFSFVTRAVEGLLGLPRPDGLTDPRIAGNEFRGRLDGFQIGYSAVAEAFRNGDVVGVVIVFILFGLLLGQMDRRLRASPYGDYAAGVVFFVLVYHVRQPSVSLVANLCAGALVILGWKAVVSLRRAPSDTTPSVGEQQRGLPVETGSPR